MESEVMARVQIINRTGMAQGEHGWRLEFQWCRYLLDDGGMQYGYRFIWIRPDGSLQAARGQARIPKISDALLLIQQAKDAGWGDYDGNLMAAYPHS